MMMGKKSFQEVRFSGTLDLGAFDSAPTEVAEYLSRCNTRDSEWKICDDRNSVSVVCSRPS